MKLQFLTLIIITTFIVTGNANGQNLYLGPRIGANFSNINGLSNNSTRTGWELGGFVVYKPLKNIGFTVDLLLTTKGSHIKQSTGNESSSETSETYINLVYLQIPILCNIYLRDEASSFRPRIFIGPSIAARLSAKETINYRKEDLKSDSSYSSTNTINSQFQRKDLGITIGTGFDYKMKEKTFFSLDIRYTQGLIDLRSNSFIYSNPLYNQNIVVLLGIGYKIGK